MQYYQQALNLDCTHPRAFGGFLLQKIIVDRNLDVLPLEPLRNWQDILASGINPKDVKLVGVNGGKISALEYRIALSLGARVGIIKDRCDIL